MTNRTAATSIMRLSGIVATFAVAATAAPAVVGAQTRDGVDIRDGDGAPSRTRTRIGLGPQFVPSYPGSDSFAVRPFIDFSRAREGEDFTFEAPDEAAGFAAYRTGPVSVGPSINFEGRRRSEEVGGELPDVGFTVELGGYVQYDLGESFRLRGDVRYGITGHNGWVGVLGADYIIRDGDREVISFGPRVSITDSDYQNAYFGVTPEAAIIADVPAFDADGGVQAVGATAGYLRELTPRWGFSSYVKYERLVGDSADSPVVLLFGSRNQFSGGLAVTYTFGAGVR